VLFLCVFGSAFAAPLERDYASAPAVAASKEEREAAYLDARYKVMAAAGKYEKTPYRYGGMDRSGIDCSGLVYMSFKDALSVTIPRSANSIYNWSEKISKDKLQPGDLVFFKTDNTSSVSHVGIYVGDNRFIHAASAGTYTGVIYSNLDESYWARTYFAAGRALPEIGSAMLQKSTPPQLAGAQGSSSKSKPARTKAAPKERKVNDSRYRVGMAVAPSWNVFPPYNGNVFRGFASHIGFSVETYRVPMVFGLELRPEWDGALEVFRLPITLSLGINDKFRIFGGPVISFGDDEWNIGERHYSNGTTWFGAAGITIAPFDIKISNGKLAPYIELAWQSYIPTDGISEKDLFTDIGAGCRFSTGLRYIWRL